MACAEQVNEPSARNRVSTEATDTLDGVELVFESVEEPTG